MTRRWNVALIVTGLILPAVAAVGSVDLAAQTKTPGMNRMPLPVVEVNEAAKEPFVFWAQIHFEAAKKEPPKEEPPAEEPPKQEPPAEEPPMEEPPSGMPRAVYMESEEFRVPEGQVLVLEYANAVACTGPREKISLGLIAGYDRGGMQARQELKIVVHEQGVFAEPDGVYLHFGASQPMKVYIQGGQSFRFSAWRSGAPTHAEASFWVTGYLAPAK